ncbi:MAG: PQQ-binding-like beta-propeller repeat protein, partial [Candidatus Dormibacteraeota bacterium]|nr:PQQ-binding-like beta-propeller repeat protein [Candidatus Dormibacteraeota bacterium]
MIQRRATVLLLAVGLALFAVPLGLPLPVAAATAPVDPAVAYQVDPAHSGGQPTEVMPPPLQRVWSFPLAWQNSTTYPLIVGGAAYLMEPGPGNGSTLYAVDLRTGTLIFPPLDLGQNAWTHLAYDAGKIFAQNSNGVIQAVDALTGRIQWLVRLRGQLNFDSPPTAAFGSLYVTGESNGGTLYAVSELDGSVRWSKPIMNSSGSAPVVTATTVYVTQGCQQADAFDTSTGSLLWEHAGPCVGGLGHTASLYNGRLYVRDTGGPGVILDAVTGSVVGSFTATAAPALVGTAGYFLNGTTLEAHDLVAGTSLWTFTGDGTLDTAPLASNGNVFIGSHSGTIYELDSLTGHVVWSDHLASPIPALDESIGMRITGLALGQGTLIVPSMDEVVAYAAVPPVGVSTPPIPFPAITPVPPSGTP